MPETPAQSAPGTWSVPECPFTIAYAPEVLDDIRLAVMDAFFSLPRGGAEIGGILLGRNSPGLLTITGYQPLECEHAMGPSFVLSGNDEARLKQLVDQARKSASGLQPVGWYHSHTRSEIFLSDADQQIHKHFFPEPWQVALVFKPHTFQPMRCGFFFRESNGSMHSTATYQEFSLEPMPLRPLPTGVVPPMLADTPPTLQREPERPATVINVSPDVPEQPEERTQAVSEVVADEPAVVIEPTLEAPSFAAVAPEERSSLWLRVLVPLAIGLVAGAIGFQTREYWLPKKWSITTPAVAAPALAPPELSMSESDGQLQIRWDRTAPAVQQATGGMLTIADGNQAAKEIHLERDLLRTGVFTYGRETEQVDVALAVNQPSGPAVRSLAAFVGKLPPKPVTVLQPATGPEVTTLKKDLADAVDRDQKLEKSLADANERIRKLAKSLADKDAELKQQQRKRLGAQDPGK